MQTQLIDSIAKTAQGKEADAILRSCVHCGFCTATCPTYQLLGDEDDGPRGRIYLIKSVLEGNKATHKTQQHLDRCLTCRSCETTCPSGVNYHRLLDIGREEVEKQVGRTAPQQLVRWLLVTIMPRRWLFSTLMFFGQLFRAILPPFLKEKVPAKTNYNKSIPAAAHSNGAQNRTVIMLEGCVQPSMAPNINAASRRVLDKLGVSIDDNGRTGCCGAVRHHLNAHHAALNEMKHNIDKWLPILDAGAEAIVVNASGCGIQIKDYSSILAHDTEYAKPAQQVSEKCLDIAEFLITEKDPLLKLLQKRSVKNTPAQRVAFHSPCTLQHGEKVIGAVESLLTAAGFELTHVADSHLCCGSAGTYSVLEPTISTQLRSQKLTALNAETPGIIATANIGCLSHMQPATSTPVKHWIELIDDALTDQPY